VILTREAEPIWLDPSIEDPGILIPLLKPYPAHEMMAYPVRALVNNPSNDIRECIVPLR